MTRSRIISILRKVFKWLAFLLLGLLLFFIILVIVIRTPWAQQKIVNQVTSFVAEKVDTRFEVQRLFLTFRGNVQIEGVYLEDQTKDTLVYINELEAGVSILPLIKGDINISRVDWDGLVANVNRGQDSTFNFQFLIDAFAGESTNDTTKTETESELPHIGIGPINLSNFKVRYSDKIMGMDSRLSLGKFRLRSRDIDLNAMQINLHSVELANVSGEVEQWLAMPDTEEEDTSSSPLPFIAFDKVALENINLSYKSIPDSIETTLRLGQFEITDTEVNLNEQDIAVDEITLKNTDLVALLPAPAPIDTTVTVIDTTPPTPFVWPDWKVKIDGIDLAENNIQFQMGQPIETPGQFNASDIKLEGFRLLADEIKLKDRKAHLQIKEFAFRDKSGFELDQLAFNLELNDKEIVVGHFGFSTPNNSLQSELKVTYAAIDSLIQNPMSLGFNLDFDEANLSLTDVFFFSPDLAQDTFIQSISPYPLMLSGSITGKLSDINISDIRLSWLNSLQLVVDGRIEGLPDTHAISMDIPVLELIASRQDLAVFIEPSDSLPLPKYLSLKAKLKGNTTSMRTNIVAQTEMGSAALVAGINDIMDIPAAKGTLKLGKVQMAQLAGVPELKPVSLTLDFDGKGKDIEQLVLEAKLAFQDLTYDGYDYSKLGLAINVADQKANIVANHTDDNLDFILRVTAVLDTLNPAADLTLDLKGADLRALGLSEESLKIGTDITASYMGKEQAFDTWVKVKKTIVVKGQDTYRQQPFEASLKNETHRTELDVASNIINGQLRANTSIDSVIASLSGYLDRLSNPDSLRAGILDETLDVAAHFTINNSLFLTEIALPELTYMDTIRLDLDFHPSQDKLHLKVGAPKVIYADYQLDSLNIHAVANATTVDGALAFRQLKGGPIDIHQTRLGFGYKNNIGSVELGVKDSLGGELAVLAADIDLTIDTVTHVHLVHDKLVLNGESWKIPEANKILLSDLGALYSQVSISNGPQSVSIENVQPNDPTGVKVNFDGFELSTFTTILHTSDSLLRGNLNGSLQLTDMQTAPGIVANINLRDLTLMGNNLGVLQLQASNRNKDKYDLNLSLKGKSIGLFSEGYFVSSDHPSIDMKVDLKRMDMQLLEGFAEGQLKNSSGYVYGKYDITGPSSDMQYEGYLAFNEASFNITMINNQFTLSNDKISVNNEGVVFNKFSLIDANGKKSTLDGTVNTQDVLNPKIDLRLISKNFQLLNSTRQDNDVFYGKALIDTDVKITGTASSPKVKAKAVLRKGSDITLIVPESRAEIEERKGLVRFANMKDTLNTILQADGEIETQGITGIDLSSYFEIDPETRFLIVIDERSGDQIEIAGEAKLNLEMTPNGLMTLSGIYEVKKGSYDMNFYGLAKRNFKITSGSKIAWSGDPLDGEMDLTAQYDIETSPRDLMADQLSQSDASTSTLYRQNLPFEVLLNIDGALLKPEISFDLDMPESSRQALGGNVYKRLLQINQTETELNKQVFSLIVLNRFFPSGDGDSEGTNTETVARSSVSKMLSGQLNAYSAKYLKGVEVNFDVNSYYSDVDARNKTDLDISLRKALFNERLVFQVGSQVGLEGSDENHQASDVIGDVSLEYLLTKEGQYRLKAFRENQYQDLVEGQLVVSGLSLMFNKDFNTFKELLKRAKQQEQEGSDE